MFIRDAKAEDADELLAIYAPYVEKTAITFEYEVPSTEEFRRRIETIGRRYEYIVLEEDGQILGYAYVGSFHERPAYDWVAETSIYVREDSAGRGLGRMLYEALEEKLRRRGFLSLCACIAAPIGEDPYLTDNSIRFHEHLGYRPAGHFEKVGYKFGRWYDMVYLQKTIGDYDQAGPSPFEGLE